MNHLGVAISRSLVHVLLDVRFVGSPATQLVLQFVLAGCPSLHFHREVHPWWSIESERSCNLLQVELIDVEDVALLVTRVGLQVGTVGVLCRAVEVIVPLDQLHELVLDGRQLFYGEFVLVGPHFLLPKEAQEAKLVLKQEEQSPATTFGATACPADSVDVVIRIIGRVKLDDPVHLREIKTTLSHISAKQNASVSLAELKVGRRALLLFLFSVDILYRDVDIIEKIRVEFDSIAA